MRVAVLGLWHLGSVTAACTAAAGHEVIAFDPDPATVAELSNGRPPVAEHGLADLIGAQAAAGRLRFTTRLDEAVRDAEVVWITFDTPVDADDRADTEFVERQIAAAFPHLADGALMLSSSQLPVGTVSRIAARLAEAGEGSGHPRGVVFAAAPENLRLGRAIETFTQPDRVVVGVDNPRAREIAARLFAPITDRIEWMSVASAEMTKHAVNAFLATSVTFINELAALCEPTGADAKEVERGLKTERRIGPAAYLSPGGAFAGGTLARDVMFLRELGQQVHRATPLMDGVHTSNAQHRGWTARRLEAECSGLKGRRIAVWGLTYKPGTDTLRRSSAVELCEWLVGQGAQVAVHDPAAGDLPPSLGVVTRESDPLAAAQSADALVVATEWPEYRQIAASDLCDRMARPLVIDPNRFLQKTLGSDRRVVLVSVGQPRS
jgi:UDPglucose 6-dehydrogenase